MAKVIVVGGGIMGAAVAYHLTKGGAEVMLVDRRDGGQATEAAVGMICPWISQRRNKAWYQLAKRGARYYPSLIEELREQGISKTGYARVGVLSLQRDEKKLDEVEERAYLRREDAPEMGKIQRLTPKQTQALFPPLAEGYGGILISGGARVDGRNLRKALVEAAQRMGMDHLKGHADLLWHKEGVSGVKVNGKSYEADQVVLCAGAWLNPLLAPMGLDSQVSPQKGQIVEVELPRTDTGAWPVLMPPDNQYILPFDGGRIVLGSTHESEAGFDDRVTAGGVHLILKKALACAPGLAQASLIEMRAGIRPKTPRFLPVFGPVKGFQGLWLANGLGSTGITIGPYLGRELAKQILGQPTELDPHLYTVDQIIKHHDQGRG